MKLCLRNSIKLLGIIFIILNTIYAAGDPNKGKELSKTCVACHGTDGNGLIPTYPKIAGQYANYLLKQLIIYKSGANLDPNNPKQNITDIDRHNDQAQIMYTQVKEFSLQDLEDLAVYYSQQKITPGETDPQYLDLGNKLYRGGDLERHIPACAACHGPAGAGNHAALFPKLSGQNAQYIISQMQAYKSGERKHYIMELIAQKLTEQEINAVASFASGLH